MRPRLFVAILFTTNFLACAAPALQGDDAPQMTDISQKTAKPGEIITVLGLGLSAKNVDEVYLTDHKFDMRVKVLEQTDKEVKFRVPPFAKPGRMQMLFLSKGDQPKLLEQPVYLLIEDPETETVTTAKAESPAPKQEVAPKTEEKTEQAKGEATKPESGPVAGAAKDAKQEQGKDQAKLEPRQPHNN